MSSSADKWSNEAGNGGAEAVGVRGDEKQSAGQRNTLWLSALASKRKQDVAVEALVFELGLRAQ